MGYCAPRGIPYDVWLGIADGWTEYSRQAALAWATREGRRCSSCGQVHDDWIGPDGIELRIPPFEVVDEFCPGCKSLELHRIDLPKDRDASYHQVFRPVEP